MSYPKIVSEVKIGDETLYVDIDCGEVTFWGPAIEAEYGPIEEQGCDRCETGKAQWRKVLVEQ